MSRGLLKKAIEQKKWDLLDKLLERDCSHVNDKSMFTDTWGEWWSPLYECVLGKHFDGVTILLKHGADRNLSAWGDGMCLSPVELAKQKGHQKIIDLLESDEKPKYQRKTDPAIPEETAKEKAVNRQREIADETGLMFQSENFE